MTARTSLCLFLAVIPMLVSCDPRASEEEPASSGASGVSPYVPSATDLELVSGQMIFVPAYAEILLGSGRSHPTTTSLAIHNSAVSSPLVVKSVRHYDTDGKLVKEYVEQPLQLAPLATKVFLAEQPSKGTGAGANFIVEWAAEKAIYEPVVEAVIVAAAGNAGYSLISPGRVMKQDE